MTDRELTEHQTEKHFKARLDDSLDTLDYTTQLKLERAREAALSQPIHKTNGSHALVQLFTTPLVKWGASTVAIAATVAAITITQMTGSIPNDDFDRNQANAVESIWLADIELLAADEELEFIEELDFYEWLEQDAENTLES